MVEFATFVNVVPDIEIRDGMVYISTRGGTTYCYTIAMFRAVVRKATAVLAANDAQGNVLPTGQPARFIRECGDD